jgi:regulatory protein
MSMKKQAEKTPIAAYDQAVKYLSIRIHTVFELRNKLKRKGFPAEKVEEALERLQAQKYLNDEDFARTFIQNLIKYKTFGYFGIKNKLRQRGIDDKVSGAILDEELDLGAEKKIAQKALGKSFNKDKMKLAQMLQRKGFKGQVISDLVGQLGEE